jgi:hypothetical protein
LRETGHILTPLIASSLPYHKVILAETAEGDFNVKSLMQQDTRPPFGWPPEESFTQGESGNRGLCSYGIYQSGARSSARCQVQGLDVNARFT